MVLFFQCLSELENQNRRLPEFLNLLNDLSKEQTDNVKVVNTLERGLKDRIKIIKRLKVNQKGFLVT